MTRKHPNLAAKAASSPEKAPPAASIDAVERCRPARLAEIEADCLGVLAQTPNSASTLCRLGVIALARHDAMQAIERFRQAAVANPKYIDACIALAITLRRKGQLEEAVAAGQVAHALRPENPEILNEISIALHDLGRQEQSCRVSRAAIVLTPGYADAYNNQGIVLADLGRFEEAIDVYRIALVLQPNMALAHNNLGIALKELCRYEESETEGRAALKLKFDYPAAWSNLGNTLADSGRLDEAIDCYRTALEQRPEYPEAYNNLGYALKAQGHAEKAIAACRQAVVLKPNYAGAHNNLAYSLLLNGEFIEGWREYEWRWLAHDNGLVRRVYPQPLWEGQPLEGRTLLLYPEQGFGDQLQFCRYATVAAERGARVVLMAYPPLVRLMATLPGVDQVVSTDDQPPPFDYHQSLMSMPRVLGTTLDTVPADTPYLHPDPAAAETRQRFLASLPGLKVGLVWAGDPRPHDHKAHAIDQRRSIDPLRLRPLLTVPGTSMVSLQMNATPQRIEDMGLFNAMVDVKDFADTAAIVANLDLVVTVDTSMVHLVGALGKPVWLLSRYDGCWRWLLKREDSPWYPTLRLFRQPAPDAWEDVVRQVATAMTAMAARETR